MKRLLSRRQITLFLALLLVLFIPIVAHPAHSFYDDGKVA